VRPRILVFSDFYLPGHRAGGPIRTIAGLVHHLGGRLAFAIVTRDRDHGENLPYSTIPIDAWTEVAGAVCRYLPPRRLRWWALARLARRTPHDVLYVNSLFSYHFAIKPLLLRRAGLLPARPVVLAPRGELDPGALALSFVRKRVFLVVARAARLYAGVLWHASTPEEAARIRRWHGAGAQVHVARDVAVPVAPSAPSSADRSGAGGSLRVAFVSRISPKKNLEGALEILAGVRSDVDFHIFGPCEDERYWRRCQRAIDRLPPNVRARYLGVLPHDDVAPTLRDHDLLLLPTYGENFGHVILEALLAGCPVLVSDRTPWRALAARGVGWDLPLEDVAGFRARLEAWARTPREERERASRAASRWAAAVAADAGVIAMNEQLFARALAARQPVGPDAGARTRSEQPVGMP
jgi:glycosyltransferase involved in cell wall biosynthesis